MLQFLTLGNIRRHEMIILYEDRRIRARIYTIMIPVLAKFQNVILRGI